MKFAVIFFLSRDRYCGGGATDCSEILHHAAYMSQMFLFSSWGRYCQQPKTHILGL